MNLGEMTIRGRVVGVTRDGDASTLHVAANERRVALEFDHEDFELVEPKQFAAGTEVEARYQQTFIRGAFENGKPLGQILWFDDEGYEQELAHEVDYPARHDALGSSGWQYWSPNHHDLVATDWDRTTVWSMSTLAVTDRQAIWQAEQLTDALNEWMEKHPGDDGMYEIVQHDQDPLTFLPESRRVFISPDREDVTYWVSPYGTGAFPAGSESSAGAGSDWRQNWVLSDERADVRVIGNEGQILGGAELRPVPAREGRAARAAYDAAYTRNTPATVPPSAKSVSPATEGALQRTDATTAAASASAQRKEQEMAQGNNGRLERGARENLGETTVRGNLVEDPRRVVTKAKKALVVARVAETPRVFDREQQEWVDGDSRFYDVAIDAEKRPRLAANVESSLRKGHDVVLSGRHAVEPYIDQSGEARLGHRLWAENVSASLAWTEVEIPVKERGAERGIDVDPVDHALGHQAEAEASGPGWDGPSR